MKERFKFNTVGLFTADDKANSFWEKMGYSLRTNLNYRNKSLNANVPTGE